MNKGYNRQGGGRRDTPTARERDEAEGQATAKRGTAWINVRGNTGAQGGGGDAPRAEAGR